MTTQNTQPEKIDTNEIVVQQSASETPIASPEVEVAIPVNMQDPQKDEIQSNTSEQQAEEESRRSFTDYIEEFRQKEVQYSSLVQDTERNESASSRTTTPPGDSLLLEGISAPVEEVASPSDIQTGLPVAENGTCRTQASRTAGTT